MDHLIKIQTVEPEGDDGLIVTFSDGTTTGYVAEELLALRPCREPIELYSAKASPGPTASTPPLPETITTVHLAADP